MNVREAEQICRYVEALTEEEHQKLRLRPDYAKLVHEYETAQCLTDLWVFADKGLGLDMRNYWYPLHGRLARFLSDWTVMRHGVKRPIFTKLVKISREHRKTWWGVIDDLWCIARDPSSTHMIRSHKDEKVFEIIRMVKDHIVKNKNFRERFSWVKPEMEGTRLALWKKDKFRVVSNVIGEREATVEGYGIKTDATGSHYGRIKYDDITNAQIERSDIERANMLEKVKHDASLGKAGTRRIIYGTPYDVRGLFFHFEKGDLSDIEYDLFECPATFKVPGGPWVAHEPILLEDRRTVRLGSVYVPDSDDWTRNLKYCQSRIVVWSEAAKDVHTEIREIEWNDANHIRFTRPIPEVFGQPSKITIMNEKPSSPNCFTLDDQHTLETPEGDLPRASLVIKRRELGGANYSSQWDLNPVDPEKLVLSSNDIKWIDEANLPTENVIVFRTTDFASDKKTGSGSSFMTGWWHVPPSGDPMLWVRHMKFGNLKSTDILMELFVGVLRVEGWGATLRETTTEEEGRWQTIKQFMKSAQPDPYEFFKTMGAEYEGLNEKYFRNRGAIMVRHRDITRGRVDKPGRIAAQLQPAFKMGMVGFVRGIEHVDDLLEEVNTFTLDGEGSPHLDILDTLADQIQYGPSRRRQPHQEKPRGGFWDMTQRRALNKTARERAAVGWRP